MISTKLFYQIKQNLVNLRITFFYTFILYFTLKFRWHSYHENISQTKFLLVFRCEIWWKHVWQDSCDSPTLHYRTAPESLNHHRKNPSDFREPALAQPLNTLMKSLHLSIEHNESCDRKHFCLYIRFTLPPSSTGGKQGR